MNHQEKLKNKFTSLDLGKPIFELSISTQMIRMTGTKWSPNLEDGDMYNSLINENCSRSFDTKTKKYTINEDTIIERIEVAVARDIDNIFKSCSPAKEPKRTKAYKTFNTILRENRGKIEFMNSIFDIAEYYHQVTQTESINKSSNDVHRKNIFQLLSLMEKSYGKSKTNSNK